jgi:hypothetical protein
MPTEGKTKRRRSRWLRIRQVLVIALLIASTGCAALVPQSERQSLPPEVFEVMEAWIVSLDEELRTLTVKATDTYETWTVSVVEQTRIRAFEDDYLTMSDLQVGDRIEIRGSSRISNHVTAAEIERIDRRPDEETGIPKM